MQFPQALRDAKIPAALITNFEDGVVNPNFLYLTQYDGFGCLYIPARGSPILYVPEMEMIRARKSGYRIQKFTKKTLKRISLRVLGIDYEHTSLSLAHTLRKTHRLIDIAKILERLRMQKSEQELRSLARACHISDMIFAETLRNFHHFHTEQDVAKFMNTAAAKHDAPLAFDTIVAAGPNAAIPHHKPTNAKLRGFVVIDFGVRVNGYCSDTSRTVFKGRPTRQYRELYALVLRAQEGAIAFTEYDRRCKKIHEVAKTLLGKYCRFFTHSVGHGVGIQIHEAPAVGPFSSHLLLDNVPFTIEPGIYLPKKLGIRIEDTLVLKYGKPVILTKFPKKLMIK